MDILDELNGIEQRVRARLNELRSDPSVIEWERLRAAAVRLGLDDVPDVAGATPGPVTPREPVEETVPPASDAEPLRPAPLPDPPAPVTPSPPRQESSGDDVTFADVAMLRGWRRGGPRRQKPSRKDDVLRLVQTKPGISVREVAEELGVDPTGLYRVVGDLQSDGAIRKEGRKLQPVGEFAGRRRG